MHIVVGMVFDQVFSSIQKKLREGLITIGGNGDLVLLIPHDHADQRDINVERFIQRVDNVDNVFTPLNGSFLVPTEMAVRGEIDDHDEFNVSGVTRGEVRFG